VLFIERSKGLSTHSGQVSFPGGGLEESDTGRLHTALRETEEEIGLDGNRIQILGRLDDYVTITDFHIVPYVGVVDGPLDFCPNEAEVDDIFLVPLETLLNMEPSLQERPEVPNMMFRSFVFEEHVIWGATAAILDGFLSMIRREDG
jgi:8-oxo-dGTP pyrophosphatase MutT (NUDIX family)